jgi:hypothetical protein
MIELLKQLRDREELSDFNKGFKKAILYNPKENK